ncbi:MAG: hypothetical protein JOY69_03885 [Candidatus Eremiobacteraeota bacterium]|nr:hypothetical protein [Candidatus Eremiobacteraeota bacterium]MBV8372377.1 hypothetical protein [Candidatus Eremiobacteraeota bacterium]
MRSGLACALALLAAFALAGVASAQCRMHHGDVVVLYSSADDPDVLVWDSRFRLRDYRAASFDEAQALLPHAFLAASGTRAEVESCVTDFVKPSLLNPASDAVGVVIIAGPRRNERGWVSGTDIRLAHH